MDEGSLAVLALTNRLVDAGVPALKASELWSLLDAVPDPGVLFGLDQAAVAAAVAGSGLDAGRVVRLLDTGVRLGLQLDALFERGITPVTAVDDRYPQRLRARLGPAAPPVLYAAGDLALLGQDGVGVVGSRDIGPDAVEVTRKVAHQVAGAGLGLVSGGAKGVDRIAMASAYEAGGLVIGVLADSLQAAIGRADNRRAMLDGRACLCTPYGPDSRFTAGMAMGRNKIVYGLSRVTLVVASADGDGGTWSGATEALRKGFGRVAVWTGAGAGPGNGPLAKLGAIPIGEPEAVLTLGAEPDRGAATETQMALTFTADPPVSPVPQARPASAIAPRPTGECWCGCGKATEPGAFFVSRHAPGAAQRAVVKHFGSVEAFLVMLGETPELRAVLEDPDSGVAV